MHKILDDFKLKITLKNVIFWKLAKRLKWKIIRSGNMGIILSIKRILLFKLRNY
jgi:hypothetical protein